MTNHSEALTNARIELDAILHETASKKTLISYAEVARRFRTFDLTPNSHLLARILCMQFLSDMQTQMPILSALVINQDTGRPGRGFFRLAHHYFEFEDDEVFWLQEVTAAFDYYAQTLQKRAKSRRTRTLATTATDPSSATKDLDSFIKSFFN